MNQIKVRLDAIEKKLNTKAAADFPGFIFSDLDGSYAFDGQRFESKKALEDYVNKKNYTQGLIMLPKRVYAWGSPDDSPQKAEEDNL